MDTTRPAPRYTITLDTGPFVTDGTTSILEAALAACGEIDRRDAAEAIGDAAAPDWLRSARAGAIARAFRSLRWAGE